MFIVVGVVGVSVASDAPLLRAFPIVGVCPIVMVFCCSVTCPGWPVPVCLWIPTLAIIARYSGCSISAVYDSAPARTSPSPSSTTFSNHHVLPILPLLRDIPKIMTINPPTRSGLSQLPEPILLAPLLVLPPQARLGKGTTNQPFGSPLTWFPLPAFFPPLLSQLPIPPENRNPHATRTYSPHLISLLHYISTARRF